MSEVVFTLLNPFVIILIIILGFHHLLSQKHPTTGRFAIALFMLFSIPYPIYKLVQTREFAFAPLDSQSLIKSEHYHIMVLGAGKNNDPQLSENLKAVPRGTLSTRRRDKMVPAIAAFYANLLRSLGKGDKSQAQLLKETAVMLGVDSNRIECVDQEFNTQTEAQQYTLKFDTTKPLIVCTSALHMSSAKAWFQYYGVPHVYATTFSYSAPHEPSSVDQWMPSWSSFFKWQNYFKEVLGTWMVAST